ADLRGVRRRAVRLGRRAAVRPVPRHRHRPGSGRAYRDTGGVVTGPLAAVPGRLEDLAAVLGAALAAWAARDDSKAQPEVRQAAGTAMDAIDAMQYQLNVARQQLVAEIRASDDAAAARADAMLAQRREAEAGGTDADRH